MQDTAATAAAEASPRNPLRPTPLQASKLSSAQKHTRSEHVCLLLGGVAIPQREESYLTTAHILRRRHKKEVHYNFNIHKYE